MGLHPSRQKRYAVLLCAIGVPRVQPSHVMGSSAACTSCVQAPEPCCVCPLLVRQEQCKEQVFLDMALQVFPG